MIEPCDTMLLSLLEKGDYKSFDTIYDRYWDILLRIAVKKTGDWDSAMDIVQDLFVELWQKRHTLEVHRSLRSYLISALYYKLFMYFRREGLYEKHIEQYKLSEPSIDWSEIISGQQREEQYQDVISAIEVTVEAMPDRMRIIFNLKYYRSMSNQEIADSLGISIQTVKNQLSKALNHVRQNMQQQQLDPIMALLLPFVLFI